LPLAVRFAAERFVVALPQVAAVRNMSMRLSRREMLAAGSLAALPLLSFAQEPAKEEKGEKDFLFNEWTKQSERSVQRGVEWLMKTMHRDGGCGVDVGQPPDIGCTAMVGLSLLSLGNTPVEGSRSREIRSIVNYLLRQVENMPSDDITSQVQTQLQNKIGRHAHTFFATVFLCEVVGEGYDPEPVRKALKRLVNVIVQTQSGGHWGQQSWAPMLGTVMGWVALRAAHQVGMKVGNSPEATGDFIIGQMKGAGARTGSWMHDLYKNATGVRVLFELGKEEDPVSVTAFKNILELITKDNTAFSQAGGEEYLAFHLITETMLQKGGADWKTWFPTVRDKICGVQNADGSWTGHHCITSRTFCTAAACLVLSSPNRFLPISQG
jgi:hypothetical protein